ncbi:MAG TPA: FtsX-like permease family protein, partial [Blastocatellia bacterium]|nr:FtsX-like permease family protein [Blastocatellia bacterium]
YLAAMALIALVRRARHFSSFTLRQTINSLYRPGNQTRVIVMVVGLGSFLVIATQSLQANLMREFDLGRRGSLPNMFLIDIQTDQAEGLAALVEQETGERPLLVPTVRTRIVEVNGREVDFDQAEMRRDRGRLGREYVVTYRPNLEANETIVAGEFWDASPANEPEVSLEESMRGMAGLDLGSAITFDIQGRKLTARVTSFRQVDWRNSRTGFMILFRPGALENAPQMLIGAINGPTDEVERSRFQRAVLDAYPNVSVIDIAEIVRTVKRIVDNVSLAVSFIGGFVFLSGALILVGSVAMTKFQRIYEAAVLKTLGAKRKTLLLILLLEYGLLGLVAGVIGSGAAVGLSWATSRYVFDIPWDFTLAINLAGIAATVLLVTVVGALSTVDVLAKKPLAILRGQ